MKFNEIPLPRYEADDSRMLTYLSNPECKLGGDPLIEVEYLMRL